MDAYSLDTEEAGLEPPQFDMPEVPHQGFTVIRGDAGSTASSACSSDRPVHFSLTVARWRSNQPVSISRSSAVAGGNWRVTLLILEAGLVSESRKN
ncbi:hypothetical protein GCM10009741_62390 [Kribbella lupini]|uniref:Uncharacterized protein n=1 Tax=Kribbella lupini TaxID=291602 RepID=A0ABN2C2W0_9ACTN